MPRSGKRAATLAAAAMGAALLGFGCRDHDGAAPGGEGGTAGSSHSCSGSPIYLDADGDGMGRPLDPDSADPEECMRARELPPGFSRNDWDCDDTDPTVYAAFYPDEDGDGVGRSDPERDLCTGDAAQSPDGYANALYGEDCDDAAPSISPWKYELFADTVDSDCDGNPDPDCGDHSLLEGEELPDASGVTPNCQGGFDLAIVQVLECAATCAMPFYVAVANLGDAPYDGTFALGAFQIWPYASDEASPRVEVTRSLAPGESTEPIFLGELGHDYEVRIDPGDSGDCDLSNDSVRFSGIFTDCFLLIGIGPWPAR
jgi:hypothetical protein